MVTVEYAKDPFWNDAAHTSIHLTVKFAEFEEEHPFAATPWDPMPHGIALYNQAVAGEFGSIGPYPEVTATEPQPVTKGSQTL